MSGTTPDAPRESWSYSGELWTDGDGRAVVVLPPFVRAHRAGFEYELTPLGSDCLAQVAEEIAGDRFTIATDEAQVKVAWRVTALRDEGREQKSGKEAPWRRVFGLRGRPTVLERTELTVTDEGRGVLRRVRRRLAGAAGRLHAPCVVALTLVLGTALVPAFVAPPAAALASAERWRPTAPPELVFTATAPNPFQLFNDYAIPERLFSAGRVVVHYVTRGIDAPPLNDDDGDGIPDYVERVGDVADSAVAYFERRRFAVILADAGGPDARPDLYISRFMPGTFGVAFPAAETEEGAFVVVSNALDPSGGESLGSLYGTVAHELFHLVQFSYFAPSIDPAIPAWTLEGSAAAMEQRVFPDLDDIASTLQLRPWFRAPGSSITSQSYGAQLLWRYLDERSPRLLRAYLARLAAGNAGNEGGAAFVATFGRVTGKRFAPTFLAFATAVAAEHGDSIVPYGTLGDHGSYRASVAPLAIHYTRLSSGRGRTPSRVALTLSDGVATAHAALTYEWASDVAGNPSEVRRIRPTVTRGGRTLHFTLPPVRSDTRFRRPTLIIANSRSASSTTPSQRADIKWSRVPR
jgi:hypothetical protein